MKPPHRHRPCQNTDLSMASWHFNGPVFGLGRDVPVRLVGYLYFFEPGTHVSDTCRVSILSLQPAAARRMNVTRNFAPWRKTSQRPVRGMIGRIKKIAAPRRRTPSNI